MTRIRLFWRSVFDVRPGEYGRLAAMTMYLLVVLFAYYILKPVSRAIFLNKFDIDKLPWLYVLIAAVGGVLAYFYTKLAVKSSLRRAVDFATIFAVGVLVAFWWLIQLNLGWVVYAFNIWVSLFSIILVSQGWFIAANIFTTREAKRLYGILGVGSVIGAAFGGTFTAFMVRVIGTTNLILACAGMVALSYIPFLFILAQKREALSGARAAETTEEFSFREIVGNLRGNRHLQVIMAIMVITFVIDVMVEFQFNAWAKLAYQNKNDLTAFLGNFYGFWLNLITFVCQFFLTSFIVSRFGVGGTLQIMPVTIAAASLAAFLSPSILSTAAARLTEASTRYSFNKTGMELLYLPLPLELRNRTKAFVDVFVDRLSRGLGGMILVLVTSVIAIPLRGVALIVLGFALAWILLSIFAQKEYVTTVRKRLESRRLDIESARISFDEPGMIRLLEEAASSDQPRRATYALSLLANAPGYDLGAELGKLVESRWPEVRGKTFELALDAHIGSLTEAALKELRSAREGDDLPALRPAVCYALAFAENPVDLARMLLSHPNYAVAEEAVQFLSSKPDLARQIISPEWVEQSAASDQANKRRVAAMAIGALHENKIQALHRLFHDEDPGVVAAACKAAAKSQERQYVLEMIPHLADPRVRGVVIESMAAFDGKISGMLGDMIADETVPLPIRRQIPRVLRNIPTQRSVDILLPFIGDPNLTIRSAVLRALNRLREAAPNLDFGSKSVTEQILNEARYYYAMNAALAAFREYNRPHTPAGLLVNTLDQRLRAALERLFRLLGLRYPPAQMRAAYLALQRNEAADAAAALEFLDNVLEKDLKRVVVPLLDDPGRVEQRGRDLFGIQVKDPESALGEILSSGDEWLVACAMATAAQLGFKKLVPEISRMSSDGDEEISRVARDAMAVLA